MAAKVTAALTGTGIWGVEFFLADDGVYFSELSPRPHDTGMVTLAGTQNFSEFELHARAVLGLPIPEITLTAVGASSVILSPGPSETEPTYTGLEAALAKPRSDLRIFSKPTARQYRRMGITLASAPTGTSTDAVRDQAKAAARGVTVVI